MGGLADKLADRIMADEVEKRVNLI